MTTSSSQSQKIVSAEATRPDSDAQHTMQDTSPQSQLAAGTGRPVARFVENPEDDVHRSLNVVADKWYQSLRDMMFAIECFFNEKKSGQFTQTVNSILQFINIVLRNDMTIQFYEQFKKILSNRTYVDLMSKGIITKAGSVPQQGEFFVSPATKELSFEVDFNGSTYIFPIRGTLGVISAYGKKVDNHVKATKVSFYVCGMLSESFCSFILKYGPSFMVKPDRDNICGASIREKLVPPYGQGDRMSSIKNLLGDAAKDPWVSSLMKNTFGDSASRVIVSAVDSFDPSKVSDIREKFASALVTGQFSKLKESFQSLASSFADNTHTNDGIKSYHQE
jgi:hypothetical protein